MPTSYDPPAKKKKPGDAARKRALDIASERMMIGQTDEGLTGGMMEPKDEAEFENMEKFGDALDKGVTKREPADATRVKKKRY